MRQDPITEFRHTAVASQKLLVKLSADLWLDFRRRYPSKHKKSCLFTFGGEFFEMRGRDEDTPY